MRTKGRFVAALAGAAVLTGVAAASPGQLDPAFGNGGAVATDFGGTDQAFAVAEQTDGKLVVGGSTDSPPDYTIYPALTRYTPTGVLDPTFGNGGKLVLSDEGAEIVGLAVQPDGKLVAVLSEFQPPDTSYGLVERFNADGTRDTTFATGGVFTSSEGDFFESVALQPDGRIVAAGTSVAADGLSGSAVVYRLNANGTRDTTFSTGGAAYVHFDSTFDQGYWVVVQPDGKLDIGGNDETTSAGGGFALARLLPNGTPDATFGANGVATASFPEGTSASVSAALQPDGKLVVGGDIGDASSTVIPASDIALARFDANGALDPTFGNGGTEDINFGQESPGVNSNEVLDTVALQQDGKIVAVGSRSPDGNANPVYLALRLNSDGSFDPTFGSGGVATASIYGDDAAFAGLLQPDGKIVGVGFAVGPAPSFATDFGVVRWLGDDTPAQQVSSLRAAVAGAGLPAGTAASLEAKLDAAAASLPGSPKTAANQLDAFANEVRAQAGKKIPAATAAAWAAQAAAIAARLRA